MPRANGKAWRLERTRSRRAARRRDWRRTCRALLFFSLGALFSFVPGRGRADDALIGVSGAAAARPPGVHRSSALDRLAVAVDGAESSFGTNPGMWRPNPLGPQGRMQVSAAAAADVGGGDRFDPRENFALGRAYLGLMYRRFGSWSDAVAAYNWGPGRLDAWIKGGRVAARLPGEVALYQDRVLFGSALPKGAWAAKERGGFRRRRLGIVHAQPRPTRKAALSAASRSTVLSLYGAVMAASAKR
jgi:Transglycosylase SLT domain